MGKSIVITGAGAGLGSALARRFAGEGETVILLGRTFSKVQKVAEELGEPAFAVECDVGDPDSVRKAFAAIAERHPKIDVLINNAAIYEPFTIAEARDDQIQSIINTNLAGPIYCSREAIPMMEKGAYIIHVGSEVIIEPFAMLSLYQCTKSGLERLSETMVKELEPLGIRVTLVRAGKMMSEDKSAPNWDPDAAGRFYVQSKEQGVDMMKAAISHCDSVTDTFRSLLDLKPDFQVPMVWVGGRKP
ncbi:MAG: SDR family NAD(P)-dependent oxidoreductase [Novosphingobium sp.]|nr:SDR family NAD(P)-dependent oxidoreductase [Novosphingobium sp.]